MPKIVLELDGEEASLITSALGILSGTLREVVDREPVGGRNRFLAEQKRQATQSLNLRLLHQIAQCDDNAQRRARAALGLPALHTGHEKPETGA